MPRKRTGKAALAAASPGSPGQASVEEADRLIGSGLELVASFLRLSAVDGTPRRPDEALVDTAERIKAVAHLHALLSRSRNGDREMVVLDDHLLAVVDHMVDDAAARSRVVFLVNADPVPVPVRVAGMLGQIVNEIVTAASHAVDPKFPSTVQVECGTDADGTTVLRVGDDGNGYIDCSVRVRLGLRPSRRDDKRRAAASRTRATRRPSNGGS